MKFSPFGAVSRRLIIPVAILTAAADLPAEGPQLWNETIFTLADRGALQWRVEGDSRFRRSNPSLYDRRAATEVKLKINDRVTVLGTYLLRSRWTERFGFALEHRAIGALGYRFFSAAVNLTGETSYERHIGRPERPDFNRYRQSVEMTIGDAGVSPWIYQDFAFERSGFVRSRSRAGARYKAERFELKIAYQFESRIMKSAWAPRHAIFTEVIIDRPLWR